MSFGPFETFESFGAFESFSFFSFSARGEAVRPILRRLDMDALDVEHALGLAALGADDACAAAASLPRSWCAALRRVVEVARNARFDLEPAVRGGFDRLALAEGERARIRLRGAP